MLKEEFEKIANIEVSLETYKNIIEPMYMATNLDKQTFVSILNLKAFALKSKKQLINDLKKLAKTYYNNCIHFTDYQTKDKMMEILEEIRDRFDEFACFQQQRELGYYVYAFLLINNDKIYLL